MQKNERCASEAEIDRLLRRHFAGDLERRADAAGRSLGTEEEDRQDAVGGLLPLCFGTLYGLALGVGLTLLAQWAFL